MSNAYNQQPKDSQFAINVHNYLNMIIGQIVNAYAGSLPKGVRILRVGYNVDKNGKYIKGSEAQYIRSDNEEILFRLVVNNKRKPIVYLR